jgi:endo-alpha-1,4-polygalactosaminidase (GH114 family)
MKPACIAACLGLAFLIAAPAPSYAQATKGQAAGKAAPKGPAPTTQGTQPQPQGAPDNQQGGGGTPPVPATLVDPREAMRDYITEISTYARKQNRNFAIMTMGGLELFEKVDPVDPTKRAPASTYIRSIDGLIVRELNYHPPRDNKPDTRTDEKVRGEMMRLANIGLERGLKFWSIDYAANQAMAEAGIKAAEAKSFIPFPMFNANGRFDRLPGFPARPLNENPDSIIGIGHVKNFMVLTDTMRWDTQEQFVQAIDDTNYDAIVLDSFFRGREPFDKRAIDEMKYKKLGSRRLVLAMLNIAQAEDYRFYWKPNWKEGSPSFIQAPLEGEPDKFNTRYWDPAWKQIISGNPNSFLYGLITQGFDGAVLEGVESYKAVEQPE